MKRRSDASAANKNPAFAGLSEERMKGLEPSTFCMATRPDTPMLVQQPYG
jgi:hypothetical protein